MDLTGDYRFFDGTETVTHTTTDGEIDSVLKALRQDVMVRDESGAWIVDSTKSIWYLADAELSHDPARGHSLQQADETVWIIQDAEFTDLTEMWTCNASKASDVVAR